MSEREWREASDMRRSGLTLAAVVGVAAALRFWGLADGLPHAPGADESELMARAVGMMKTGDFNPHVFDDPGFYIHVQLIVACLRFLVGATFGEWQSLAQVSAADFYLWGRGLTAVLGTATVLLLHQAGMRWGTRYALLAAGLLAVMPLHVRESHYVLTDVPVTFFVTLTLVLSLRAHESARAWAFAVAGGAAGLAAATKYPGALAMLLPLVAVWMTPGARPSRAAGALAVMAAAAAAFLAAAPYTILDLPAFLDGYAGLTARSSGETPVEPAWLTYLEHLRLGLRTPAFLLAAAGLILGIVRVARGPGRVRWTLAVLFPVAYFLFVSRHTPVVGRHLLPLGPFVCLLAALAVVSGVSLLRRFDIGRAPRTALIGALTVAALLPPAIRSVAFDLDLGRTSTIEQAHAWIDAHLPKGARVAIETRQLQLPDAYQTINVPRLVDTFHSPGSYEQYVEEGFEYVVASSAGYGRALEAPNEHPRDHAAYMAIFEQSREVARFTPSRSHPGPEIRILALKK